MYEIAEFKNKYAEFHSDVHQFDSSVDLLEWFSAQKHEIRDNKDGKAFGMFIRKKNRNGRLNDDIAKLCGIVLDVDEIAIDDLEGVMDKLASYQYFLYSTYSNTDEKPKLRIVLPLDAPVEADIFASRKLGSRAAQLLGIKILDDRSNVPAQIYYLPSSPSEDNQIHKVHTDGKVLSIQDLPTSYPDVNCKASSGQKKIDHDKTVAEAHRILNEYFDGNLIFVGRRFYLYEGGIWRPFDRESFRQKMFVDIYQSSLPIAAVQQVINVLEVLRFQPHFPSPCEGGEVIVLRNCTIEPMTRKVLPHSPAHWARNRLSYDYDEKAKCPTWEAFLDSSWRDDSDRDDKKRLLQQSMGNSLTRSVKFQKMQWLIGAGANGKSLILDALRKVVGEENTSAVPFSKFGQRFALAQLYGKTVNISAEISSTAVLADSELKAIVAGDPITLERKMEPPFEAKLEAKLWAAANFLPRTKDHSHGFFRRILILTFNRVFSEAEQDKDLVLKLEAELPGIFNWALEGLRSLHENGGFTVPESSKAAIEEYKVDSNSAAQFVRDHVTRISAGAGTACGTRPHQVYSDYAKYCRANGYMPLGSSEFGKRMTALEMGAKKSNGKTYYPVQVTGMEIYSESGHTLQIERQHSPTRGNLDDEFKD